MLLGFVSLSGVAWADPGQAALGKAVYARACAPCHGVAGDGRGPQARWLSPKPRDLTRGLYRFKATPLTALPTDDDLYRVVAEGLPGSSMPGWKRAMSREEMRQVVHYIKGFSTRFEAEAAPEVVEAPTPVVSTPESVARGKTLFGSNCAVCHGQGGAGDGPTAAVLKDAWGDPIRPRDLTAGVLRGGATDGDLFRTISYGLSGTPMPEFRSLPAPDRWALVHYVQTLAPERGVLDYLFGDEPNRW